MIIDIKIAVPTLLTIIIGSAINDMRSTAYALSWENVKNSVGTAIFMSIIISTLKQEEQMKAVQTHDVLQLMNQTLPVPTLLTIIIGSAINDMRSTAYALSWENVKMLNI
jgi:LytS/YehU family sensor histidine kinase